MLVRVTIIIDVPDDESPVQECVDEVYSSLKIGFKEHGYLGTIVRTTGTDTFDPQS